MTRSIPARGELEYRIGPWTVKPSLNRIEREGASVDLEPRLMDLLVCLAENPGRLVSKEDLLDRVWKVEHVSDGTLSHAIADLRRALGDDARRPSYIETIRKRGYRLVASTTPGRPNGVRPPATRAGLVRPLTIATVVALVAVAAAVAMVVMRHRGDRPGPPPRIVVLPFENIGGGPDGSFSAGLTDEIISRLAAVRGLQVVSRTTAFGYETDGKSVQQIGQDLGVEYILEGAVRWSTERQPHVVRITPQLIRVDTDGHLWSGQFDRHPGDVLDVQSEIASQIVSQLDLRLAGDESREIEMPPTGSPAAYQAYLAAIERRNAFDSQDILIAAQMYQRATEHDPDFARAWAGLAEASGAIYHMGYDRSQERCDAAGRALDRAVDLAPEAPDTMRAAAFYEYHCRADATAARLEFARALESWPGDALAMRGMAFACRRTGRTKEAESWFRRALEVDPRNPTVLWNLGATLGSAHRYDEALTAVNHALALGPDLRAAHFAKIVLLWLGWGDVSGAGEALERVPGARDATWHEYAFRNACYAGDWEAAIDLSQRSPEGPLLPLQPCLAASFSGAADASEACANAIRQYRTVKARRPESLWPRLLLVRALSLAGQHDEARAEVSRAVALRPYETDAIGHTEALIVQAQVLGRAGSSDAAVKLVEQLLEMPSDLSPARLRIDPEWSSLRHHPRIQELIGADPPSDQRVLPVG